MKRIGLISDTHGYLDPKVFEYFAECDEVWHAGDIGTVELAEQLEDFKTLRAVIGNIDGKDLRIRYPEQLRFECEGLDIMIHHYGGKPDRYDPRVRDTLRIKPPNIFICGHSHMLRVLRDPKLNNMLFLNPGAAGIHGFHKVRTLLRFTLNAAKVSQMEVIELGKRGTLAKR